MSARFEKMVETVSSPDEYSAEEVAMATMGVMGAFKDWHSAVDLMRKAEADLIAVLEKRRHLLPDDEVRAEWLSKCGSACHKMLRLPLKLAPRLEGQEWQRIQQILDEEIRMALSGLSEG